MLKALMKAKLRGCKRSVPGKEQCSEVTPAPLSLSRQVNDVHVMHGRPMKLEVGGHVILQAK